MKTKKQLCAIALLFFVGIVNFYGQTFPFSTQISTNSSFFMPGSSGVYNTAFGSGSIGTGINGPANPNFTGSFNSAFGGIALRVNLQGSNNSALGYRALTSNVTGSSNVGIGFDALRANTGGSGNVAVGTQALVANVNGILNNNNTAIGNGTGWSNVSGSGNVFIGNNAGFSELGSNRLYINNDGATFNHVNIFARPLIYGEFDNGNLTFNVSRNANSRLVIGSGVANGGLNGTSGLRFANMNSTTNVIANPSNPPKVLSVNSLGDVILVNDIGGGITNSCLLTNFVTKTNGTTGNLTCSQIFDNGTGVGVGYSTIPTDLTFFSYNYSPAFYSNYGGAGVNQTGTIKFHVNGNMRTTGVYQTSDKKFKKDIKPIDKALEIVQSIEGKTYLWDADKNKEMNFDGGGHSGFIAQELEKVLPHLVITSENGEKAVNYMELLPYLVEAIKEQQTQINDLKAQISDNFKAQNQELIGLTNTKIISVSPNPSKDIITISFNVEKSVQSASIQVFDLNGTMMSNLKVNDRDNNLTRTIQKDNFGRGIYVVSLVVNGKSIDTKKIIFE